MALERWVAKVTSLPGEFKGPKFYQSEPQAVVGYPTANYRLLAVFEGDTHGLETGVFVQTNLTGEGGGKYVEARRRISQQVFFILMDDSIPVEGSYTPDSVDMSKVMVDRAQGITLDAVAKSREGGIVFKVNRATTTNEGTRPLEEVLKQAQNPTITPTGRFGDQIIRRIRKGQFRR